MINLMFGATESEGYFLQTVITAESAAIFKAATLVGSMWRNSANKSSKFNFNLIKVFSHLTLLWKEVPQLWFGMAVVQVRLDLGTETTCYGSNIVVSVKVTTHSWGSLVVMATIINMWIRSWLEEDKIDCWQENGAEFRSLPFMHNGFKGTVQHKAIST